MSGAGWTPADLKRIGEADEFSSQSNEPMALSAAGHLFGWSALTATSSYGPGTGGTPVGSVRRSGPDDRIQVAGLEADVSIDDIGANPAALRDSIDIAYRSKYEDLGSRSMVTATSAATTLRLNRTQI